VSDVAIHWFLLGCWRVHILGRFSDFPAPLANTQGGKRKNCQPKAT
jgi:hypothetical protein